jgi:hypothetical protein
MKAEYDLSKLKSGKNRYALKLKSTNQMTTSAWMEAAKFEHQFDEGVDMTACLDLSKAGRVFQAKKFGVTGKQ